MLCLTLGVATPSTTYAAPMTDVERIELIASLRLQIIELLKQLIALRTGQAVVTETPSNTNQGTSSGGSSHSSGSSNSNNTHNNDSDEAELSVEIASTNNEIQASQSSATYKVDVTAVESDFTFTTSANTTLGGANVSVTTSADKSGSKYEVDEGETETITIKVSPSSGFNVGSSFATTLTIQAYDENSDSVSVDPVKFETEVVATETAENTPDTTQGELLVEVTKSNPTVSSSQNSTSYTFELTAYEDDITFTANANTNLSGGSVAISSTADENGSKYEIDEGNTEQVTITVTRSSNFTADTAFKTTVTVDAEDSDSDEVEVDELVFTSQVQ